MKNVGGQILQLMYGVMVEGALFFSYAQTDV